MPRTRNNDTEGGLPPTEETSLPELTPLPLPTEGGSWTRDEQGLLVPYTPPHQE